MSDVEERLRELFDEMAEGVDGDVVVPSGLVSQALHRRRRRLAGVTGAAAMVVLAVVGALAWSPSDGRTEVVAGPDGEPFVLPEPGPAEFLIDELPVSPLSAREDAAGVWTGSELIVWGGNSNGMVTADGAAFNPESDTWRPIGESPLSARTRHMAAWTGTEMVVWGGTTVSSGVGGLLDGAAYDPATDSWRTITAAPSGTDQTMAATASVEGRVVIAGGGSSAGDGAAPLLVYDPASDRWTQHRSNGSIVSIAEHGRRVALASYDPRTRTDMRLALFDPVSGDQRELPRLPDAAVRGVLDSAGLVSVDGGLIVSMAWTDGGRGVTVVAVLPDGAEEWTVVDELDPDDFTPGSEVTTSFPPGPTVWTGEWLFGRSWMPTAMAPGNGRVVDRVDPQSVPCGSGSVSAWTGDELLSWGGQNCRREGPSPQVDTGVSIRIRPTD